MNAPKDYEECESCSLCETLAIEADVDSAEKIQKAFVVGGCILACALILLISGCHTAHAEEYTDTQIVNAIRKAEGTWTYGIKSVKCSTSTECRQICRTTVKRNRARFAKYGFKNSPDFIAFLASRYCPIGVKNDPSGLNKNWQKNVRYFLAQETK